jgi:hypothetical protein
VVGIGKIENCIANYDCRLFMIAHETSRERTVMRFDDNTFSNPLPELRLGRPELLAIAANNQGISLLSLLLGFDG